MKKLIEILTYSETKDLIGSKYEGLLTVPAETLTLRQVMDIAEFIGKPSAQLGVQLIVACL